MKRSVNSKMQQTPVPVIRPRVPKRRDQEEQIENLETKALVKKSPPKRKGIRRDRAKS